MAFNICHADSEVLGSPLIEHEEVVSAFEFYVKVAAKDGAINYLASWRSTWFFELHLQPVKRGA